MEIIISIFVFIFGTIIGSFLNVVILRYGEKSIINGSSQCPKCKKKLKWYELVPVLSWILLLGRCSKCKKRISIQYPLLELATGILFLFQYFRISDFGFVSNFRFQISNFLVFIALSLLVVIFVYDLYHKIIPDLLSYSFGILGVVYMFLNFDPSTSKWNLLAPIIFFLPFYLLWRISDGKWIGLGDGKLAFGFGGFLGLIYGTSALILSFWIGAVFAIGLMLIDQLNKGKKNITMKTEIPFGPFMIIGFLLVYFWEIDITGLSTLLNVL